MNRILGALLVAGLVAILILMATNTATAVATPAAQEAVPPGTWELQEMVDAGGTAVAPVSPANYTLQFVPGGQSVYNPNTPEDPIDKPDGRIDLQLDCNGGSANYVMTGDRLTIADLVSTDMGCQPPSLASEFERHLLAVTSYVLDGNSLVLFVEGGARLRFAPAANAPAAD